MAKARNKHGTNIKNVASKHGLKHFNINIDTQQSDTFPLE